MENNGYRAFIANGAVAQWRRVKLSGTFDDNNCPKVEYAGLGEDWIGVSQQGVADGESLTVRLRNVAGTVHITAAKVIAAGAGLYGAASGKVSDAANGELQFTALEAAVTDGDVIECIAIGDTGNLFSEIDAANGLAAIKLASVSSAVNELTVTHSATGNPIDLSATGTDTNISLTLTAKGTGTVKSASHFQLAASKNILDSNGNELIKQSATTDAVNEVTVANAATGNNPTLSATGGDTNIGLTFTPKGTGSILLNGPISITEAKDIVLGTTTGTKIGTAANQKIGFFNATPVVQRTHIADAAGGTEIATINAILVALETLGLVASA